MCVGVRVPDANETNANTTTKNNPLLILLKVKACEHPLSLLSRHLTNRLTRRVCCCYTTTDPTR